MDSKTMADYRSTIEGEVDARIETHQERIAAWSTSEGQQKFVNGKPPLNVLADGDSWFNYPAPEFPPATDIIKSLSTMGRPQPEILSLAHFGDATSVLMGVAKREKLREVLADPDNGKFDALLFSGGGDDIAGDQFCLLLQDYPKGSLLTGPALYAAGLDRARVNAVFTLIEGAYLDLFAMYKRACDVNSVPCVILLHAYDFAYPSGIGVWCMGPWLKPSLDARGWTDPIAAKGVVTTLLMQFDAMMQRFVADPTLKQYGLIYVHTQGTLASEVDWANELHPENPGFKLFAGKFYSSLKTRFPDRI